MSSPSSPPPSGGNAKYLVVGVLLLLGMVGLLVWKFRGEEPPKPPLPTPSPIPTQQESKLDEIPPPPPIEDAGPETGPATASTKGGAAWDPCAVKTCNGAVTDELQKALATRARQARRCYENELKNDNTLKGRMTVSVRVAANGAMCASTVTNSDIPQISPCVQQMFRSATALPAPKGGCVDTTVPLSFVPGR